jgi:predicted enzyme related to lactoylglutathione lyase
MRAALLVLAATATGCRLEQRVPVVTDTTATDSAAIASVAGGSGFFQGLRTAKYTTADLLAAKAWYREVTGVEPYFDEPYYVGFNIGGFELGIVPVESAATVRPEAGVAYWGVANAAQAWNRLMGLGATPHEPIQDVGGGVRIGSVHDPFGNVLGIVENPAFRISP